MATGWKKIIVSGSGVAQLSNDAGYITDIPAIINNSGTPAFNSGITKAEVLSILNVEDGADVTDFVNVQAAGALMDSEVTDLAGIKSVTISTLQPKPSEGAFANGDKTKLDNIEANADVTDTANVTAAGALMDTEVSSLSGIKTLTVPDSTTISSFGASLVDDADASAARTTLGLGTAATTNSTAYATADQGTKADNALPKAGGQMTGNITFSGAQTVDGRDLSADGAKLDNIEANADVTDTDNVKAALNANLGTLTIGDSDDIITIGNDLVVTGDLTVSGNTTTIDVTNLNVTDQFINLNDGGAAADGGLVVEGAGVSFGWDNSEGRWAFDAAGATEGQTSITADAYASAVVTSDLEAYRKNGNIRVDGSDIYIYTEA